MTSDSEIVRRSWDHPAIRFNLVRCYVQLGKNVDAAQNLELALTA